MQRAMSEAASELFGAAMLEDPYPLYARLRRETPVAENPRPSLVTGDVLLSRYEDVYATLRDHETFSSDPLRSRDELGQRDPLMDMLRTDPPLHTKLRALVGDAFTPKRVRALEPRIRHVVDDLLDLAPGPEIEVMSAIAVPLPIAVIAELLGIPVEQQDDFRRWSDARVSTEIGRADRAAAMDEMFDFFRAAADERRRAPRADVITTLVEGRLDDGPLSDGQLLSICVRLLVAGNETTRNLIGNMLNVLADRPDLWESLRADRSLVEAAVDETLRYDTPVHVLVRYPVRDVEVAGVTIERGTRVGVLFGSANRDSEAFPNPDEFRLDRELHRHTSFGVGIHYCLGAPLARTEAIHTLDALLDRYETVGRGVEPAERQTEAATLRGFTRLPLRFA